MPWFAFRSAVMLWCAILWGCGVGLERIPEDRSTKSSLDATAVPFVLTANTDGDEYLSEFGGRADQLAISARDIYKNRFVKTLHVVVFVEQTDDELAVLKDPEEVSETDSSYQYEWAHLLEFLPDPRVRPWANNEDKRPGIEFRFKARDCAPDDGAGNPVCFFDMEGLTGNTEFKRVKVMALSPRFVAAMKSDKVAAEYTEIFPKVMNFLADKSAALVYAYHQHGYGNELSEVEGLAGLAPVVIYESGCHAGSPVVIEGRNDLNLERPPVVIGSETVTYGTDAVPMLLRFLQNLVLGRSYLTILQDLEAYNPEYEFVAAFYGFGYGLRATRGSSQSASR